MSSLIFLQHRKIIIIINRIYIIQKLKAKDLIYIFQNYKYVLELDSMFHNTDRVPADLHRFRRRFRKRLAISVSLLRQWRR